LVKLLLFFFGAHWYFIPRGVNIIIIIIIVVIIFAITYTTKLAYRKRNFKMNYVNNDIIML